jgi:hypothetical protein
MRIKNLSFDRDDSGSKKCKRDYGGAWWGLAKSAFGGILESGGRFCVGAFVRNLMSIVAKVFSCLIHSVTIFF